MKKRFLTLLLGATLTVSTLHAKPFLIDQGLPHYTKVLMKKWDDPKLNLTQKQKKALLKVRKETISTLKKLKPQIATLQKEIIQASKKGVAPKKLEKKVEQLAKLKKKASMTHLQCIYNTKKILTPTQLQMVQLP